MGQITGVANLLEPLAGYARRLAGELCPDVMIASVHLLTFPRVLGLVFQSGFGLCAARW